MATATKGRLTRIQALRLIEKARREVSDMELEIEAAKTAKAHAVRDLWGVLETAKIGSLAFEKPRKVIEDSDKKVSQNTRLIATRQAKIREWERIAE